MREARALRSDLRAELGDGREQSCAGMGKSVEKKIRKDAEAAVPRSGLQEAPENMAAVERIVSKTFSDQFSERTRSDDVGTEEATEWKIKNSGAIENGRVAKDDRVYGVAPPRRVSKRAGEGMPIV